MDLKNVMPWGFLDQTWLGMEMRQAIALIALVVAVWILSWPIGYVLLRVARGLASRTETRTDDRFVTRAVGPVRFLATLALFGLGFLNLGIPDPAHAVFLYFMNAAALLAFVVLAMRVVDLFASTLRARLEAEGQSALLSVLPTGRKAVKFAVFLVAVVVLLQNLGVNVGGLIAGLGIGGLAVALAAQKTLENLFGGLSVLADGPVRVGDFIKFGDQTGTVEEIGLRSTRIRTLDRTVIAVPNADFASMKLENFAVRDRMRLFCILGLRYETSPDQLRWLLVEIRRLLLSHPRVTPEPARVRFVNFGDYSLDLEVFAYVDTRDWADFLEVREDIYLSIMDLVAASGTDIAFPSQTAYMSRDGGVNDELGRKAEETIAMMRERKELPLPEYPR